MSWQREFEYSKDINMTGNDSDSLTSDDGKTVSTYTTRPISLIYYFSVTIGYAITDRVPSLSAGYSEMSHSSTIVSATDASTSPAPTSVMLSTETILAEVLPLLVMWVLAIVGNTLAILVIYRSRRLQSTTNYFIVSLACSDIFLALFVMPFVLGQALVLRWTFLPSMCKFVRFVQHLIPAAALFVFLSISVDRFYTIIYPLRFVVTRGRAKQMIAVGWVTSTTLAAPCFYFFSTVGVDFSRPSSGDQFCSVFVQTTVAGQSYIALYIIIAFVLPLTGVAVLYIRISKFIWRVGIGGRPFQRTTNPVPRAKVKMIKVLMILNATAVLFVAPYFVVQIIQPFASFCATPDVGLSDTESLLECNSIYVILAWFYFASAAFKPVLYVSMNSNFRRGCREMFCMSAIKCYRSHAYTITTMTAIAKKNHVGIAHVQTSDSALPSGRGIHDGSAWPSIKEPALTDSMLLQRSFGADSYTERAWPGRSQNYSPATFV